MNGKAAAIAIKIIDDQLDMIALVETWLCASDLALLDKAVPVGYSVQCADHGKQGGGVALIQCSSLTVTRHRSAHPYKPKS